MPKHQARVEEARRIIREALKRHKCYLAYSGGKDSTAMLHLVAREDPGIFVYHHSQGRYMPREAEEELIEVARAAGARNLHVYPAERDFWTDIVHELSEKGFTAVFVGLRKEEGSRRRQRMRTGRNLTPMREFWPLANWTWMDVWAYLVANGVRYHSYYDRYAPLVGWDQARFHAFFDPRMRAFGKDNLDGILSWRYKHERPR